MSTGRRLSPRPQNITEDGKPYYDSPWKRPMASSVEACRKKTKVDNKKREFAEDSFPFENGEVKGLDLEAIIPKQAEDSYFFTDLPGLSTVLRLRETLRRFNLYFIAKAAFSRGAGESRKEGENSCNKPQKKRKGVSRLKRKIGDVHGYKVGHHFHSRAEMLAVGFHGQVQGGIDYMGKSYEKLEKYKGYTFPLAVSVVLSGQYEDDLDDTEEIIYTGHGGNDLPGTKHQVKDQVLLRGNLALKNCIEQSVPVRVIRCHKCSNSPIGKVYIYDGLYKVVDYWAETGISGFNVFKFRMKRLVGQDELTDLNQVHFVREKASIVVPKSLRFVRKDISNGQEAISIPVTNLYDPPMAPTGFQYIKSNQIAENISLPPKAPGCKCKGSCTNTISCSCADLNGGDFPYVKGNGGRLIEPKDVVFECGPNCGCGPECVNRTSQKELRYHLEVYRTQDKGWAVRSWDFIPSGSPVCEYVGVVRKSDELENISENDYIFEIDCWQTIKEIGGRERRLRDVSFPTSNLLHEVDEKKLESQPESEFCIDAGSFGNVARFINHSCEPNLFVQCVLSSHRDIRLARVVLFAADDIPPLQELTYDYGYALDSVTGPDGKVKQLPCYCGTAECRKRLY